MKKLALAVASLCLAATPVLACPHSDSAESETTAPKTAEKAKEAPKAKETPAKEAPAKETAKTAKPTEKAPAKTDKVSQR
jgi:hypothetical protein